MTLTNNDITTLTKALNDRIGYLIDTDINTETPSEYCKDEIKKCTNLIQRLEMELNDIYYKEHLNNNNE